MEKDKLNVLKERAISKFLWGEREELIIEFLREEGLGGEEIVDCLNQAKLEEQKIVRKRAIQKLIVAILCLVFFSVLPIFYYFRPELLESLRAKLIVCISIFAWTTCLTMIVRAILELKKGRPEDDGPAFKS